MIAYDVRTAKRNRKCNTSGAGDCARTIKAGERYVETWASPNHDILGNPGWWSQDLCAPCANYYLDVPADVKLAVRP